MPIQSVDNFQINVAKPIDSRMVTSGTVSRTNLAYKYEGLRVYDTENKAPYVWIGGAWKQESSSSSGSGSGSGSGSISSGTNYHLLKYTGTGTTIGDSSIIDKSSGTNTNVGIGKIPGGSYALDVNGRVKGSVFEGTLGGNWLDDASVSFTKLKPYTSDGYILKTVNSSVQWVSGVNTTLVVENKTDIDDTHYLLFTKSPFSTSGNILNANNNGTKIIGVKPSTSQILGSSDSTFNDAAKPAYSFSGNTDAGLYGNSDVIGLAFAGTGLVKVNLDKTSITNKLDVTGATKLNSSLLVTGPGTFSSSLVVNGDTKLNKLLVSGAGTFSSTLDVSGAATFNGTFKISSGTPTAGKVLSASDAFGLTTWIDLPVTLPYGAIIMWSLGTYIPTGWKKCMKYASNGTAAGTLRGQIYVNGSYMNVPDMRDRNVMGSSDMSTVSSDTGNETGGTLSPKNSVTISPSQLPRHKHGVCTSNYDLANGAYAYTSCVKATATSTFSDTTNTGTGHYHSIPTSGGFDGGGGGDNYRDLRNTSNTLTEVTGYTCKALITGSVTTSVLLSGYTDDGTTWHSDIATKSLPVTKYFEIIFLIRYNPNATENIDGHFRVV